MRTARTAAAATALLLLPLAACSAQDSGGADDPSPSATPEDGAAAGSAGRLTDGMDLPLGAYRISDEDQRLLEAARDRLIVECMSRYDLEYTPPREERAGAGLGPYTWVYGADDPAHVAEHGYLHPLDLDPNTYAPPHEEELTDDQVLALYGDPEVPDVEYDPDGPVPEGEHGDDGHHPGDGHEHGEDGHGDDGHGEEDGHGHAHDNGLPKTLEEARKLKGPKVNGRHVPYTGCHGEAQLIVNDPGEDWVDPTVIHQLENDAAREADEDERVAAVVADWSACMAERGHAADNPLTVQEDLGLESDVSGSEAIEVAVADVACKAETDLVERWSAVDAEYQEKVISEQADLLERYQKQHEQRLDAARAVLADG